MKSTLFYLTVLIILIACNGQVNSQTIASAKMNDHSSMGDTVNELSSNIMVIYQDTKSNYWFGSWKDGLYKYDGKSILHFTTKDGLPSNRVEEIKEDKQGNLYFNTSKGLCQYNGNSFLVLVEINNSENDWKLNPDDLWFKSLEHPECAYRFDGNNIYRLKLPRIKLGEDYTAKLPSHLSPYAIYCVYKDVKLNVWFGTAQLGVCRYDGKTFDWITESDVTELHNGSANGVRSIAEDKHGDFWFNTEYRYSVYSKKAFAKSSTDDQTFYNRIKSIGCLDGKQNSDLNEYLSIAKDNHNNLWIAIYLHGVWKYDGEKIEHYPIQVNAKNVPIYCLYKDNNGDIWLGTHANGAFKFNGQVFEKFIL